MGVSRGDFERVLAVQQGPRAAQLSTDVPDVGAPLRLIAPALRSWADFFGKMANIGTDYTRRKNNAEREMKDSQAELADAISERMKIQDQGKVFDTKRSSGTWTNEDDAAFMAWQEQLTVANERVERQQGRVNFAEQRWRRTGLFGWEGTPDRSNLGAGRR